MKPVDVVFKKAEVLSVDGRTGIVEFRVIINDGKDKAVVRKEQIDDPISLAEEIFQDVRKKMKALHKSSSIDDTPLASVVMVRVAGDEEVLVERMSKFFSSIREKLKNARSRRLSYYDIERQITGLATDLT